MARARPRRPRNRLEAAITIAELGEFGLIAAIQELLPAQPVPLLGVGDDAAVLSAPDGRFVATTDLLVEGRHFRRDWSGPADIGVKAAAQNLADVAAMGATPTGLLVGFAAPGDLPADWALDLMRGMVAECGRAGTTIAGGDVTSADTVMLAISAFGDLAGRAPVTRAGARPGDVLAVAGRLGWSAAGLALLQAGYGVLRTPAQGSPGQGPPGRPAHSGKLPADLAGLIAAHRRPQPPYLAGPQAAAAGATSMIDISDGLVQDVGHVARASGVRIDIETSALPENAPLRGVASLLTADWLDWALAGGEDHCLVATFPSEIGPPKGWVKIGATYPGSGVSVDSQPREGAGGWTHFG